ncbi:HD-GYP domain-containing protein [Nitrosomonas marina]|uniref:Putative two-component system response regulator n=1 Tax=Nitrosomonas marina TaxID=917 RepID=A0A1H8HNC2_9PROT|nr:HD domain-containing phosphohydrolase [Nitrosomonas marina]SEN57496.1 putative two-component system response regulator [Nitrosomonas marina]
MENSTSEVNDILNNQDGVYQFLMKIIAGRNSEIGSHLYRIQKQAILFSQFADLSIKETGILIIGAGIHDVGKLSISDHILNKPKKLTASEYTLVQKHVEFGFKFLEPLRLDARINEIVLYHHENYDGSGYPDGLIGDKIPFLARMTRILDSFDALTGDRPYHQGFSHSEAFGILQKESHLYDPKLLKCFGRMLDSEKVPTEHFSIPYAHI